MLIVAHRERYARAGIRSWTIRGTRTGLWARDTRVHPVAAYDPRPRLWLGPYRVAVLWPFVRERVSRKVRRARKAAKC